MATALDNGIVLIALVFAVAFGLIFKAMLEYQVNLWHDNRQTQERIHYNNTQTKLAYLGMSIFMFICVGQSLHILGFFTTLAFGTAAIVTIPTALLIWFQLGSMLELIVKGGSAAIDIETYLTAPVAKGDRPSS